MNFELLLIGDAPVLLFVNVVCQVSLRFKQISSELKMRIFFTAGVLWIRLTSGNMWYPAQDPRLKVCEGWLFNGIVAGTYPFADQFMEEMARMQRGSHSDSVENI
jgi:hypothetical protein